MLVHFWCFFTHLQPQTQISRKYLFFCLLGYCSSNHPGPARGDTSYLARWHGLLASQCASCLLPRTLTNLSIMVPPFLGQLLKLEQGDAYLFSEIGVSARHREVPNAFSSWETVPTSRSSQQSFSPHAPRDGVVQKFHPKILLPVADWPGPTSSILSL